MQSFTRVDPLCITNETDYQVPAPMLIGDAPLLSLAGSLPTMLMCSLSAKKLATPYRAVPDQMLRLLQFMELLRCYRHAQCMNCKSLAYDACALFDLDEPSCSVIYLLSRKFQRILRLRPYGIFTLIPSTICLVNGLSISSSWFDR